MSAASRIVPVLLLLLLACGKGGETDPPPTPTAATGDQLTQLAQDAGWIVSPGFFSFSSMDSCCFPGAQCLGNNVLTPYGTWALPPAPGQEVDDIDYYWSFGSEVPTGMSRDFHLREDEAMVWVGTLPGPSAYLGMRTYLSSRLKEDGWRELVMGALGRPVNMMTIAEDRGVSSADIWGTEAAIVSAMDADVAQAMVDLLVQAGLPRAHVHLDRVSHGDVQPGLHAEADTFHTLMRVALPEDPESHAAYLANPSVTLLRITPELDTGAQAPFPRDALPTKGTGDTEFDLIDSANALEAAIGATWPNIHRDLWVSEPVDHDTFDCLPTGSCSGELWDRYLARIPGPTLGHDGEFIVVYGVNHERTGKASYSSVALQTISTQTGVTAVHSRMMPGSARAYLGHDDPYVDDLFAWVFARDCSLFPDLSCTEIASTCPGVPLEESVKLVFRAYLEPETGAAPLSAEILLGRALVFDATRPNDDLPTTTTSSGSTTSPSTTGTTPTTP